MSELGYDQLWSRPRLPHLHHQPARESTDETGAIVVIITDQRRRTTTFIIIFLSDPILPFQHITAASPPSTRRRHPQFCEPFITFIIVDVDTQERGKKKTRGKKRKSAKRRERKSSRGEESACIL
jgi:hypothetical protein